MSSQYGIDTTAIIQRLGNDRVVQLTDDVGAGVIDQTKIDAEIDAIENEFHGYANVFYVTPVRAADGSTPPGIREKLIEGVAWRLMNRRPEFLRGHDDEGDYWAGRRKELMTWFAQIASADAKTRLPLQGAVMIAGPEVRAGAPTVTSDAPRFSGDRMWSYF